MPLFLYMYDFVKTRRLYSEIEGKSIHLYFPEHRGGPLMYVIAGKTVAFGEALRPEFREYQQNILNNAQALCKSLQSCNIRIVTDGTDNHLMLVDCASKSRTGAEMERLLDLVHITVNKNTIPFDTLGVKVTSGIRIGAPAVTSRGLKEKNIETIATVISILLDHGDDGIPAAAKLVEDIRQNTLY